MGVHCSRRTRCGAVQCGMLRRFCRIPQDAAPQRTAFDVNQPLVYRTEPKQKISQKN